MLERVCQVSRVMFIRVFLFVKQDWEFWMVITEETVVPHPPYIDILVHLTILSCVSNKQLLTRNWIQNTFNDNLDIPPIGNIFSKQKHWSNKIPCLLELPKNRILRCTRIIVDCHFFDQLITLLCDLSDTWKGEKNGWHEFHSIIPGKLIPKNNFYTWPMALPLGNISISEADFHPWVLQSSCWDWCLACAGSISMVRPFNNLENSLLLFGMYQSYKRSSKVGIEGFKHFHTISCPWIEVRSFSMTRGVSHGHVMNAPLA